MSMACPEMAVDFMLLEHLCIPLIGALFVRSWKQIYAMWCLYYLPLSIVAMHMFDSDIDIKLMVFAWNAIIAFLGAFLGEWISVFFAFPRLFDIRGVRDAYARVYNWEPTALILAAFSGYWAVMSFMGYFSGTFMMRPDCSMGLSRTEELIIAGIATGIAVIGVLVVVVIALLDSTFDKVDRRLNLKYAFFMTLRFFVHYFYDMATIHMWNVILTGVLYLLLILIFWVVAYFAFGYINVRRGINHNYFQNDRDDPPLSSANVMDDRFSTIPQAQAFILVGSVVDITINIALVIGDQFSGFSNHQTILIVAGASILFWAIVSAITPRLVYSLWSGWGSGQYYGRTDRGSVYELVQEAAKNMELARLDLNDSPGGANRSLALGSDAPDARSDQTISLVGAADAARLERMVLLKRRDNAHKA